MSSPDLAEPVEIGGGLANKNGATSRVADNGNSPNSSNRINNITRLATSPPIPSVNFLSRSNPQRFGLSPSKYGGSSPHPGPNSYGSLEQAETSALDIPKEKKAEIVKKHLVTPDDLARSAEGNTNPDDPLSLYSTSHQLPGGDATHEVYKWQQGVVSEPMKRNRSKSLYIPRPEPSDPYLSNIRQPGGFRRHYVINKAHQEGKQANIITENFIDFLTMYGHFAGEDLSDDEDEEDSSSLLDYEEIIAGEDTPLMPIPGESHGTASPSKAVFLLLKSFVGTGVMFLPKAFYNGGMIFSLFFLIAIGGISLFAFLLLVETRLSVPYSFGDIGGVLYGPWMRYAVLFSITISQIGFVCAYMVFVAENLHSFTENVFKVDIDLENFIFVQVLCFIPLSMIRRISRLSFTAVIADAFILFGLLYLYFYDIKKLVTEGPGNIQLFNSKDFALFIGTAVFTFEGIGLIIPITESMKDPQKFPKVLTGVMCFISVLFVSIGVLSYAAFGDKIKTVVILNLPEGDPVVQSVQLLYALAILLSIPLQLFPAIRIMEQGLLPKSGKADLWVKWQKNLFRVVTVMACAYISRAGAKDLDKFVSLIGSFACVPLCFLYPPLFHIKAAAHTFRAKLFDVLLFLFGVSALVYTTYNAVLLWGENK